MTTELEARVAALWAKDQIRELRHRYHQAVNEMDIEGIVALFAEDAELDFGYLGRTRGREKIGQFFGSMPDLLPFIKQFIHNHIVTLDDDGEHGQGVSYMEAKTISDGQAFFVSGRYDDTYVLTDAGWRFAEMVFDPYFSVPFQEGWAAEQRLQMGYGQD